MFLPGDRLRLILTLPILPIVLAGLSAGLNLGTELRAPWSVLLRPLAYAAPPWLALIVLYVLTAANILKRWERYPATPKDPFLYHISWGVALSLLLGLMGGYLVVRRLQAQLLALWSSDALPPLFTNHSQALYM